MGCDRDGEGWERRESLPQMMVMWDSTVVRICVGTKFQVMSGETRLRLRRKMKRVMETATVLDWFCELLLRACK